MYYISVKIKSYTFYNIEKMKMEIENQNDNQNENDITLFNLKLKRGRRAELKRKAREVHNCSMQELLAIFVESYVGNPYSFNVKRGIVIGNDKSDD